MRDDQRIRGVGIVMIGLAYAVKLVTVGDGPIEIFGHTTNGFGFLVLAVIVLALPETIDMLPVGPTRSK